MNEGNHPCWFGCTDPVHAGPPTRFDRWLDRLIDRLRRHHDEP